MPIVFIVLFGCTRSYAWYCSFTPYVAEMNVRSARHKLYLRSVSRIPFGPIRRLTWASAEACSYQHQRSVKREGKGKDVQYTGAGIDTADVARQYAWHRPYVIPCNLKEVIRRVFLGFIRIALTYRHRACSRSVRQYNGQASMLR